MTPARRARLRKVAGDYTDLEAMAPLADRCAVCGTIITRGPRGERILPSQVLELLRYVDELERKVRSP